MKPYITLTLATLLAFTAQAAKSPNASLRSADAVAADNRGNALLNGKYWVRQMVVQLGSSTSNFGKTIAAQSISGTLTFDGAGRYTFAGQVYDTTTSQSTALTQSGAYRVGVNGLAAIESLNFRNPTFGTDTIFGAVGGNGIFTGSATEGLRNDIFIAIPAGPAAATNAKLTGAYWIGHLNYVQGIPSNARNSLFQVTANGQGAFAASTTVSGHARGSTIRNGDALVSQTVTGATYTFAADGTGTLNFPSPAGVSAGSELFAGTKTLYISADGNYILGGDPANTDIFFGMRPLPAASDPLAAFNGVYYWSTLDGDTSDSNAIYFVSAAGGINAFGNRTTFWHQRTSPFDDSPFDLTYDGSGTVPAADGIATSAFYKTVVGASGDAAILTGNSTDYSLTVAFLGPKVPTSSVFLSPYGVLNAASFSPVSNPLSPGELITLFGTNMASSSATASTLPFPAILANVQVMINDRAAPVYAVSPGQISAIVPYATSGGYAKVQVINNGTASNTVIMYLSDCSPGIFAVPSVGNGFGAITHANFQLVTTANPAKPGEVVLIYMTGLGAVKPAVADGVAGPTSPLSLTVSNWSVSFGGAHVPAQYNGLAPGAAGLYQINVQIPANAPTGNIKLDLLGGSCESGQVQIPIAR